jgi:hypothetical protein
MKISDFNDEVRNRNPLLWYFGWINFLLFIICFLLYFIHPITITGVNGWIKPMKFSLTIATYSWTFGWLLHYLTDLRKIKIISGGLVICMIVENVLIIFQAARGVPSHYNVQSAFDGILFSIMGIFIGLNSMINLYTLILFFTKSVNSRGAQLIAWRGGLLLFFLGGISGGLMVAHLGHTFGAPDGGPGLPFVNWSTIAGDMRAAHFLALHGLQIIPLFSWYIAQKTKSPERVTIAFFAFYSLATVMLHVMVLNEMPMLSIGS